MRCRETRKFAPWKNQSEVEDEALIVDLTWAAEEREAAEKLNEEKKARREERVMISVPGYYFTNGPWKKQYVGAATKTKHFVATHVGTKYNQGTNQKMYVMSILGDHPDGDFEVKEKVFQEYRALWLSHGSLTVPYYDLGQVNIEQSVLGEEYIDKKTVRKHRKKRKRAGPKAPAKTISEEKWNAWTVPENVHTQLKDIIDTLCSAADDTAIENKLLWTWTSMSCHLDTFLAVELAFFGQYSANIVASANGTLCGEDDMGTKRLLKVLLGATADDRNTLRNEYWLMEIENETYADSCAWGMMGSVLDHRSGVCRAMKADRKKWTRQLQLRKLFVCTNEDHPDTERNGIRAEVPAVVNWWPFPDKKIRYIDVDEKGKEKEKCRIEPCLPMPNENLRAVLMNLVARSDETKRICNLCKKKDQTDLHYIQQVCLAPSTKFPVSLVFQIEAVEGGAAKVPPELEFSIGRTLYTLYAVVFSDGGHFHATLLLNGSWYRYDDMGVSETRKTPQLMTLISPKTMNDTHKGTTLCSANLCLVFL